jgi:hypothetical protein
VLMHLKAHLILEGLVEHGYVRINERSKVCHLMESIKTKSLDAAKAHIMANADLRTNFNACVTLFKDFIAQERSVNGAEWQISAANSVGGGNNDYDHYVPDPEWQALAQDEKDKYVAARKAAREAKKKAGRGSGGGGGGKGKANPKKNPMQAKWMKKEIKRQVAKALTAKDNDDKDKEEVPMKEEDGGGHNMRRKLKKKSM